MKKAVITFLALMAALTFLSRALDSVTVTRVQVGYGKQGVVPYLIEGDGTFTADKMAYISIPENLQVGDILKHSGQMVLKGEAILCLQMESLEEEREKLSVELEKARLALEQERLSSVPVPRLTEEALAAQSVAAAQRALELGRQDLAEAEEKHASATADLEHDYIQKKNRTREEVREDNRRAMKSAGRAYESAQVARDSAVRKGEREVEDKKKKLDRLEEQEDASQQEIEKAALELERAEEDLEDIRDEQDLAVEEARAKMYAAEETYEDIDYGTENAKEELRKAYEDAVKAEDAKVEEARRKIQDLEEGLYQSMEKLENARVSDAGTVAGEAAQREISRLRQESMKLDMEQIKRKLEKIEELIADKGQISSSVEGVVADMDLKAGDRIESGRQIKLAVGNLNLTSQVDKEKAGLLKPGAKMTVKLLGQQAGVEAEITSVDQMPEDETAQVTAAMPQGQGSLGGSASLAVNMESGAYSCVIPIGALREDNTGFFCLAVQPKRTILGEEMTAVRIGLEVLEKSSTAAAVSGAVTPEMKLITESDKGVGEGDRVRVVES